MSQPDDSPSKSGPASRLRKTTTTARNNPPISAPRTARLTAGSSTTAQPSRPSSRIVLPTSPKMIAGASPTKNPSASPVKAQRASARPLWNSGRTNCGIGLNIPKPTPGRASTTRAVKNQRTSEMSFANTTFVSAASGFDENRRPVSPSKSPLKELKSQPSILAGLGFGRMGKAHGGTPPLGSSQDAKASGSPIKAGFGDRTITGYDPQKEPIKAFLRIRPPNQSNTPRSPYIDILNETEVLLTPPTQVSSGPTTFASQDSSSAKYKFTQVFGPEASQKDFFQATALPLVGDLVEGKSSLCFAYGVTASGKTYTVQGGLDSARDGRSMDPGLLPRTMDVLFNSIGASQTEMPIRPTRLTGVEVAPLKSDQTTSTQRCSFSEDQLNEANMRLLKDDTVLPIDPSAEYGVWISYAEVYNEKVYDLLDTPTPVLASASSGATFQSLTSNITDHVTRMAQMLHNKASSSGGVIKRKPLVLKHDKAHGHKYVHGLTELRVRTAEEAKLLLRHGQIHRTVFSTLVNSTSSRSHGIFTIKLLRIPKHLSSATPEDLLSHAIVSRLSIVDLAGSERTRNTQTTGERLKEAGNINKSLMVLGQCMEVLRRNQEGRERKQSLVPFRHSKLTELFQSFFTGQGRTVMIVNVNPCDTGFEENSHVMKFSAVASEVATIRESKVPLVPRAQQVVRVVTEAVQVGGGAEVAGKECSFIVEDEEEEGAEEMEESEGDDGFVNHLLEQLSIMRVKLVESEIKAAMIEAEVRDQVMQEYREKMLEMEELFVKNLALEAKEAELKTDRKIDIFNRATQHHFKDDEQEEEDPSFENGLEDIYNGDEEEEEGEQNKGPDSPTPRQLKDDEEADMTSISDEPRRKLRSRV
ncbi:hypothetical protein CROQUDRAFT_651558 [Cronartium quercuum f. sp. fusiforme G11]|uniref:Kinesin-like protein n=1 Tax=Cronartium quercuum f. sp. fusiforme G11 TaxID=708437 RepID=A0A9P6TG36_9BASI|nr:hypothetical protein CROQUDRAFT_651558 [Cronartium quercuum f. sp. fusiforme G11]